MDQTVINHRKKLVDRFYGGIVPSLWCPLLTHYRTDRSLDIERMRSHWAFVSQTVSGYLIPGATSDGWEMDDEQVQGLLEFAVDEAVRNRVRLLIGVLKLDADIAHDAIVNIVAWLRARCASASDSQALLQHDIAGFVVCPPVGANITQEKMRLDLGAILALGLPTCIYQLPQVTDNEIDAETAARLARRYPNLLMIKDASGHDQLTQPAPELEGIAFVRGHESAYHRWLKPVGSYDAFLLASSNCFPIELAELIDHAIAGRDDEAEDISARVAGVMDGIFETVEALPQGNLFANAVKAIDHHIAHGRGADRAPAPTLTGGGMLPGKVLDIARDLLKAHGLMPKRGYLE